MDSKEKVTGSRPEIESCKEIAVDTSLTQADAIVLDTLLQDIVNAGAPANAGKTGHDDTSSLKLLADLNDATSAGFQPTIFTSWDEKDINLPSALQRYLLHPYTQWAQGVVRRPTDVVFLTHLLLYLSTSVPSAIFLYYNFTWPHGIGHWIMQLYYCGPFTLLLHNHIHNNGVLAKKHSWFDTIFPYILEPLMGHTWDSYYYHHVKHHHVEGNGPDDLSSTIRYQRDELSHFLMYVGRFLAFVWIELPLYFLRQKKRSLAVKSFFSEMVSYTEIGLLARYDLRPTVFAFILPLLQMRIAMMVGNWGQHALVDEQDPKSDFRSSITLIDVPSNRFCFNDGYHTSHHLNPLRHWRDHPRAFLKSKNQYAENHALVFRNIDYLMMTVTLIRKDYEHLARCMVPIGGQVALSMEERVELLRGKTRAFTREDVRRKFGKG
ncbi:MAG: hypothetical protein M1835_007569 [Candelina submexicana]|nr:MAG: hypothetical protein M1835_007569 [Candelina submexicana]